MSRNVLGDAQAVAYLARLGFDGAVEPSVETLDALVFRHQCVIAFETITTSVEGRVPDLSLQALFDKMVLGRRGGYCFELNKLFEALLVSLGFEARPVMCRAVERTGRSPINHRGILVRLDGIDRFVDVGYGGPMPAASLALVDEMMQEFRGDAFIPRRVDASWWAVDRVTKSKADFFDDDIDSRRQTELELCLAEIEDFDFELLNLALSQPGSLFRDHLLANLRTESGHLALTDRVFTVGECGKKRKVELSGDDEIWDVLEGRFGIIR